MIMNFFYIILGICILTRGFCCSPVSDVQEEEVLVVRDVLESREFDEVKKSFEVVKDELNVKNVQWKKTAGELVVELDLKLTQDLQNEGEARKIIRKIQEARKKAGTEMSEQVVVTLPEWPASFEDEIKQKALVKEIHKGEKIEVVG